MNKTEKCKKEGRKKSDVLIDIPKRIRSLSSIIIKKLYNSHIIRFMLSDTAVGWIVAVLKCLGLSAAGFLLGICRLDYMAYPLGFALLTSSGRLSFFAYAGSALASLTYPELGFAFFGVNTLIYIIRKILLSDSFCESLRARIILSFSSAVFISFALFLSASSGTLPQSFSDSDLIFCCAVYLVGIPLSCFLLYPTFSDKNFEARNAKYSLCFFCVCIIMAISYIPSAGQWLSCFSACISTLLFCTLFSTGGSVPAGAVFGLATAHRLLCAPICISAFIFLRLYERRQFTVYPLFSLSCLAISFFLMDSTAFTMYSSAFISATVLYMPIGLVICSKRAASGMEAPVAREAVGEAYTKRMADLSKAFGSVSKLCFGFSNRMRFPAEDEVQVLVSVCSSKSCSTCPQFSLCKVKQYWLDTSITDNLMSGKLTTSSLPSKLTACRNVCRLTETLNDEYKKLLSNRFNNNKTEILAHEYATLARILKYTSRVSSEDVYYDGKMTRLAGSAVRKLGLTNNGVTVYGSRKKILDINGVPVSCITMPSEKLAEYFSAECGEIFDIPEFILDENNTFTVRLSSKETITAEYVKAVHTKTGESVSGDTVSFFTSDDSYFYALIADGMGSGRDAAMTSKLTSVFVEKLLSGGAGKGVTMELLNNLLMSKSKECFSSVDLLELDLLKKRVSFVKAGAAPAYLLRSTKLFKVSSETPPCGIIEGFCAENTSFEVFSGDIIIMLSDGITSSIDCGTALCDIMNNSKGMSPETIAGKILDAACSMSVHDDDMSCVLVKIK